MSDKPTQGVDENIWLSTKVQVRRYRRMESAQKRDGIAEFIHHRFRERYIAPLLAVAPGEENGFLMMASSCLLIEGLTAYRQGWLTTRGKSEKAFQLFFGREDRFADFRDKTDFYKGVRCGILHRGETDNGWRLNFTRRSAPLLDVENKRINCHLFFENTELSLDSYRDELLESDWNSPLWENLRKKMNQTIRDCAQ